MHSSLAVILAASGRDVRSVIFVFRTEVSFRATVENDFRPSVPSLSESSEHASDSVVGFLVKGMANWGAQSRRLSSVLKELWS